jgi:hypothetical protein
MGPVIGTGRSAYFVNGAGGTVFDSEDNMFSNTTLPVAWSGYGGKRLYRHILEHKLDYYYIDTGYFGNIKTKDYKRITKNDLNNFSEIIETPSNRLDKLVVDRSQFKRGEDILVIPPDQKVLNCWSPGLTPDEWLSSLDLELKKYTNRKIHIRRRPNVTRFERRTYNTFLDHLQNNIHAVIVWSSNCAVESVLHGVPVVNMGPTATRKVSPYTIEQIDNVPNLDKDLVEMWARVLSYSQFTDSEMQSGLAWNLINR